MPYAPGVQDISGQLRAAGIAQAGQAWSQAIGNIGKDVADAFQTYKQNQFITNQAMGQISGALKANQNILKYLEGADSEDPNAPALSPEVLKSWGNVKSGKPSMQDAATVKAFIDSYQTEQANNEKQRSIAIQNALAGTNLLQTANELAWYAGQPGAQGVDQRTIQALRTMGLSALGQGGQPSAVARQPMLAPTAAPMAQPTAAQAAQPSQQELQLARFSQGNIAVPGAAMQFLGGQAPSATPAAQAVPTAVPLVATGAPTPAAMQQDWLKRDTPPTLQDADYNFRMMNMGRRPREGATKELLAEMRKQWDEAQTIKSTFPSIEAANEAIKNIPAREGIVYAPEQLATGRVVIKPQIVPKNVLSAQEQADLAEQNRLSEAAVKRNETRIATGDAATANRGNLSAMEKAAQSEYLYTGVGAEAVNAAKQLAQGLGANVKGVEDYATLKRLSGELLLKKVALLRPASDTDISLLQGYLAGPVKTKEANLALIGMLKRQDEYDMKQAKEVRRLRSIKEDGKRLPEAEIDARMAQWEADNAIQLTDSERKAFENIPQNAPVVSGAAGSQSLGRSVSNAIDSTIDPIGAAFQKWMGISTPQK